ncbi:MAG TPA: hypothetical protein PKO06_22055, partial [Candidatus Ozemobacteraceae bacterium]|nr:hypothetical protein [Candidatus Ozemobacteraceae bacterium]
NTCLLSLQQRLQPSGPEQQETWMKRWWFFRLDLHGDQATVYTMRHPNETERNLDIFGTGFFGSMTYTPNPLEAVWAFHKHPNDILAFLKTPKAEPLWRQWLTFTRAFLWSDLKPAEPNRYLPNQLPETSENPAFR